METTYVNRANTNEEVFRRVYEALEGGRTGRRRLFTKLSERHGESKRKLYAVLVDAGEGRGGF